MQSRSTSLVGGPSPIVFSHPLLGLDYEPHHPPNPFQERPGAKRQRRVRFFVNDSQISETTPSPTASPSVDRRVLREMMSNYDPPVQPSCQWDTLRSNGPGADPLRSSHQVQTTHNIHRVPSRDELGSFQPARKIDASIRRRRPCLLGRCFSRLLTHGVYANVEPTRRDIDTPWYSPSRRAMPEGIPTASQSYQSAEYFLGNDLLLCHSISRKELRWNIGKDPSTAIIPYGSDLFVRWNRPVLGLTVSIAYIHLKESRLWRLFGPIIAHTPGPHQPITFHHLLYAIYTYFRHAVSYDQVSSLALTADERYLLDATRQERIRCLGRNKKNSYSYNAWKSVEDLGIQRADFSYGFCRFKKLRMDSIDYRSCHLVLSLQ